MTDFKTIAEYVLRKNAALYLLLAVLTAGCAFATYNPETGRASVTAIGQSTAKVECIVDPGPPQKIECEVDGIGGAASEGFTDVLKKLLDIPTAIARFFVPVP